MSRDDRRAERLAAALRANLRRRKAPDRVLAEGDAAAGDRAPIAPDRSDETPRD